MWLYVVLSKFREQLQSSKVDGPDVVMWCEADLLHIYSCTYVLGDVPIIVYGRASLCYTKESRSIKTGVFIESYYNKEEINSNLS